MVYNRAHMALQCAVGLFNEQLAPRSGRKQPDARTS
jgi:hypothetical protein